MRLPSLNEARGAEDRPLWVRLGWFAGLWAASVAALGIVALILHSWLN